MNRPERCVQVMNGQPLVFFTFFDNDTPGRRSRWGNHTTLEAALYVIAVATREHAISLGKMWVEDVTGNIVAGPFWAGGPRPTKSGR